MRLFSALFILLQLFFFPPLFSQPADTANRADDSSQSQLQQAVKEHKRWKDSVDRERLLRNIQKNGKSLDAFLAEMKEQERKKERQLFFRIGIGVVFLIVLIIGLARRSRNANRT